MKLLLFVCMCLFCSLAEAQNLKGKITGENGEPVVGATVFVRELLQGCVADENGEFQISLPSGNYTCEISSMGFEKQVRQIAVTERPATLQIQLKPTVYLLNEVKVVNRKEDRAYYVMRNAIARAPFHRIQVKKYDSEVYTKGTMRLDKIPRLLTMGADAKKTIRPLIGKLFLLESVQQIRFTAPNHYDRKVLAFSSTIPDDIDPGEALNIITSSIYEPEIIGIISPLSPGAFSYYRFRFEDCYAEGNHTIYKIRVEPRKDNKRLLEGWLYIADDNWSVVNFEFTAKMMGITAQVKGAFHEVRPEVFLPTSYDIRVDVKIIGIRAGGKYYSSVKYNNVETVEPETKVPFIANRKKEVPESPRQQKAMQQIEKLAAKEELTTREAYRMARLSQDVMKPERPDTVSPLEIISQAQTDKVTVDSMSTRRDSLYWIKMRTIPLKSDEVVSYQIKDSMRVVMDVAYGKADSVMGRSSGGIFGRLLLDGNFRLGKRVGLHVDGLIKAVPEYNFVDGFWIGQGFDLNVRLNKKRRLSVSPHFYFATARKTLIWNTDVRFDYAPGLQGRFALSFGDISADFNGTNGAWRLENALTSLVCADNFMKFYGKRYLHFENVTDIFNGFQLTIGGDFEKRRVLENHISYNFWKKTPKLNSPVAEGGVDMPDNTSTSLYMQVDYTPRMYYRKRDGKKENAGSRWPTFRVRYEKGFPNGAEYSSSYDRLDVGVIQFVEVDVFNRFSYVVTAGKFLRDKEIYFPDYKHFKVTGWVLSDNMFGGEYFLADYYRLNSRSKWLGGAFNYASDYLLIKRLPFMQRFLFDEAVHIRYAWVPGVKNYTEWGYSLGFRDIGRVGVFFGFEGRDYEGVGMRINFPLSKW